MSGQANELIGRFDEIPRSHGGVLAERHVVLAPDVEGRSANLASGNVEIVVNGPIPISVSRKGLLARQASARPHQLGVSARAGRMQRAAFGLRRRARPTRPNRRGVERSGRSLDGGTVWDRLYGTLEGRSGEASRAP